MAKKGGGRLKAYLDFCNAVRAERGGRCEGCGRNEQQIQATGEKRLHIHHLLPVAKSGVDDALVMARANVFLLCGWCHKMQHPGARSWPWDVAARTRGRALR